MEHADSWTINKHSEVPMYVQIKQYIQYMIKSGQWKPGDRVISEIVIAKMHNISRVTIRRALSELVEENVLVRKRGKGTFVKDIRYKENLNATSFTSTCQSQGMVPGSKIIQQKKIPATKEHAAIFNVRVGEYLSYLERLRFADNVPVRLENNMFAPRYGDIINIVGDNMSIAGVLRDNFGVYDSHTHYTIGIEMAGEYLAPLLGIKKNTALLKVYGICYDREGEIIYNTELFHLPERCVFNV